MVLGLYCSYTKLHIFKFYTLHSSIYVSKAQHISTTPCPVCQASQPSPQMEVSMCSTSLPGPCSVNLLLTKTTSQLKARTASPSRNGSIGRASKSSSEGPRLGPRSRHFASCSSLDHFSEQRLLRVSFLSLASLPAWVPLPFALNQFNQPSPSELRTFLQI